MIQTQSMIQLAEDTRLLELCSVQLLSAARNFLTLIKEINEFDRLERKPQLKKVA